MSIALQQATRFLRVAEKHLRIIEERDNALEALADGRGRQKAVDLAQKQVDGSFEILGALMGITQHGAWQEWEDAKADTVESLGERPLFRAVNNEDLRDWRILLIHNFQSRILKEFPL